MQVAYLSPSRTHPFQPDTKYFTYIVNAQYMFPYGPSALSSQWDIPQKTSVAHDLPTRCMPISTVMRITLISLTSTYQNMRYAYQMT
jgi:hypothetical protein